MGSPPFSVSECTTFPASFADDVAGYRAGGADGIGIWEFKLERGRDAENLVLMRESGLRATICVPEVPSIYPDGYFTEPADPRARTAALSEAVRRFAPFEPLAILAVTGNPAGQDLDEMRRVTVAGLQEVARGAADMGVSIGVEAYRQTSGAMVSTLPDTVALVDDIDAPNLGIVLDLWHCWDLPGIEDDIGRHASRLIGVQVNDWREPTRSWADRVLPGDGIIDLPALFGALDQGGFDGWYDLEIFSDDGRFGNAYPDSLAIQDPEDVTRRGLAGFRQAWDNRTEVTLLGRSVAPLEAVAARIRQAGGVATICPADVTDEGSVARALDALPVHDVVVNAAGANKPQPFTEIALETFDALFALNVRGLFTVTQNQVRRLLAEKRPGVIVNVSSQMGHVGAPNRSVYCGTKHAVEGITKALGVELAPHGIRVVAVAPTWVETPFTKPFFEDAAFKAAVLADLPIGRLGQPEDVAGAIVFLASDSASLITDTSLLIDGGWTAR